MPDEPPQESDRYRLGLADGHGRDRTARKRLLSPDFSAFDSFLLGRDRHSEHGNRSSHLQAIAPPVPDCLVSGGAANLRNDRGGDGTVTEFRPHDLWLWLTSNIHAKLAANACILGSGCFLVIAAGSGDRDLRNVAFTGATVTAYAGREAAKIRNRTEAISLDVEGRSRAGRIAWLDNCFDPKGDAYDVAEVVQSLTLADCHECAHIMVIGETGSGKSTLASAIAATVPSDAVVIDPHAQPKDWEGLTVIGRGRDYSAIADIFLAQIDEMHRRYAARAAGQFAGHKLTVIVDELPAIASSEECADIFPSWFQTLGCEARKVGIQLIVLTQADNAKVLDLDGKGQLRQNFTPLRLGSFATAHAKRLKDKSLQSCVAQQNRPAMLGDKPLDVDNLPNSLPSAARSGTGEGAIALQPHLPEAPPARSVRVAELPGKRETPPLEEADIEGGDRSSEAVASSDSEDAATLAEIQRLRDLGLSMTATIRAVFGAKGGHKFQAARREYRRLTGE